MAQYTKQQLISASNAAYFTNVYGGISASAVRDLNDSWISSSALLSGSNTFIGNQIISGTMTAQLPANYIWLGDSNGYNQAVATSSISLQGAQGIQGLQGLQGTQGIQGITGLQGLQGLQGIQGLQGTQGIQGITGLQGIQGIEGASGSQGIQGLQGTQGTQGLQGVQGLQGLQGIQGVSGSQGTQGLQGIQGADNSTQGATGAQGIQGIQGLEGLQGTTGTQGVQGFTGAQGIQGITGITGSNGAQGAQGIQGVQGTQGDNVSSGSLLVTASFANRNITFTKGDATTFDLPGFATTGSNTFNGNQTITGQVTISGSASLDLIVYGNVRVGELPVPPFYTNQNTLGLSPSSFVLTRFNQNQLGFAYDNITEKPVISAYTPGGIPYTVIEFQAATASYTDGRVTFPRPIVGLQNLELTGSLTASLQQGYAWVGDSNNRTTLVATSSFGTSIDTGSFATTGSNTFRGNQTLVSSSIAIQGSGNLSFPNGLSFSGNSGDISSISATSTIQLITEPPAGPGGEGNSIKFINRVSSSFISFDNQQAGAGNPINFTGGAAGFTLNVVSGSTGKLNINAQGGIDAANSTFTASLANGYVWVGNGSNYTTVVATSSFAGSSINTGSFATTGSNVFTGNQTISKNGGVYNMIDNSNPSFGTASFGISGASGGLVFKQSGSIVMEGSFPKNLTFYGTGSFVRGIKISDSDFAQGATIIYNTTTNTFRMLDESGAVSNLELEGTFTASLANGFTYVGNASGISTLVATSSFGGGGTTYNNPTLNPYSGSLILVANTFTSSSFAHISASANGQVNLVFKDNNNTADTIISGSGNIFTNPIAPTAGFKRFATSGNISLSGNLPQMSGSMAFPITLSNNYFGSVTGATFLGMRGPVSSSAWNINNNIVQLGVNIGSSAANNAEKLVSGLTLNSNNLLGALNLIANQSALSSSVTINSNIIAGATTLNLSSSAVAMSNNIINDIGFTFTNQYYSSSLGLGTVNLNRNTISGQSNSITISGSLPVGGAQSNSISDNFIFGGSNTIYIDVANARLSGTAVYKNVIRTGLMGNNLIVSGSSLTADASTNGSVFVGRFNADDSRRNKTSDVVFAVGTGNTTTRKTGFLIDSGSNTFIEGTLNVSGSTTMTGSLTISSSATYDLIVKDSMVVSGSNGAVYLSPAGFRTANTGTDIASYVNQYSIAQSNTTTADELGFTLDTDAYGVSGWSGPAIYGNDPSDLYPAFLGFQNKSTWTDGRVSVLTPLVVSGSLIANSYTILTSVSASLNFADDTAAAAGGVPLGGLYRNGNFVMIRLT